MAVALEHRANKWEPVFRKNDAAGMIEPRRVNRRI
jgi:hypothetical protein